MTDLPDDLEAKAEERSRELADAVFDADAYGMTADGEIPTPGDREYLRFADELVEPILNREKRGTIRYDFERELHAGDTIDLLDGSGETFATAKVVAHVFEVSLQTVASMGFSHLREGRPYGSVAELVATLREHYDEPEGGFDEHTSVDVISFAVRDTDRSLKFPEQRTLGGQPTGQSTFRYDGP